MDILTPAEFDALTRSDFQIFVERVYAELNPGSTFLDNFHIPIITTNLEAVRQGKITRLIFTLPPRSLKSIIVSVAFARMDTRSRPDQKDPCGKLRARIVRGTIARLPHGNAK